MLSKIKSAVLSWYLEYSIITGVYMLEPWECRIYHSLLFAVLAMSIYTTYLFLPGHALMVIRFVEYIFGIDSDTAAVENQHEA